MAVYNVMLEHYYNDNMREMREMVFYTWGGIKEWIERHACRRWWPRPDKVDGSFNLGTLPDGWCWMIHAIYSEDGVEFSSGKFTAGRKHISSSAARLFNELVDDFEHPERRFVP